MLNGEIFFIRLDTAACMGIMHKIMVCNTLKHENNKGGGKRDLWLIRNASCGENDDYRDEVEEVVIYQGCNQWVKVLITNFNTTYYFENILCNKVNCWFSLLAQRKRTKRKGTCSLGPALCAAGLPCAARICREFKTRFAQTG